MSKAKSLRMMARNHKKLKKVKNQNKTKMVKKKPKKNLKPKRSKQKKNHNKVRKELKNLKIPTLFYNYSCYRIIIQLQLNQNI